MTDDLTIIQQVIAGDTNAFALLVDRYKDLALSLANNVLLNRHDAEDVVQDSFVKAFSALRMFRAESKFSTWLYRIVLHTALNKRKKKLQIPKWDAAYLDHAEVITSPDISRNTLQQQRKYLHTAMQHLSEGERLCITLFYLNEMSIEEINSLTGYATANIKVLLFRGRKQLYHVFDQLMKKELNDLI